MLLKFQDTDKYATYDTSEEKTEHLYKVLVIGDAGVGKTSIIKRYVHKMFSTQYRSTIGVDFALKVINWDEFNTVRLQLWDIAGQERYSNMSRIYYKEAAGAFIVYDVTNKQSFETVKTWKKDLDSKISLPNGDPLPCILLANKVDIQPVKNVSMMDMYCRNSGFYEWFETSAKFNANIAEASKCLVAKMLENDAMYHTDLHRAKSSIQLCDDKQKFRKSKCC